MTGPDALLIRDCGPRDGLQGEVPVDPGRRVELVRALDGAGVPEIEIASFVSPRAVPAMADAAAVVAATGDIAAVRWVLVPNRKGAELAVDAGAPRLTVTISASPAYSEKNVGMTVDESIVEVGTIAALPGVAAVDVVISCAFGSPFGDGGEAALIAALVARVDDLGVERITLADTTGTATPRRIDAVVDAVGTASASGAPVGLHLHDTRGTALVNAHTAWRLGIRRFDTAVGGLGGSPFAPGAGGNLATEDLVLLCDDLGIATGIDLDGVLGAGRLAATLVGHGVPSRVAAAGPLPPEWIPPR